MPTSSQPVVELKGITKRFLDVTANKQIDFILYPGEICALLGENGAGKTTLMNILFGYYACDEGDMYVRGEQVHFASPKDAIRHGIKMVHQHFTLVPSHTVLENIIIGDEPGNGLVLDMKAARQKVLNLQKRFGLTVDPDAKVWTLSIGEQQKVEILKALYRDAQILIMDEPTAVLVPAEVTELFTTLRTYVQAGNSAVFISHKLNEVMDISDRVVVLRNGEVTAERITQQTDTKELANLMVGRDVLERIERHRLSPGNTVLEVKDLSARNDKGILALKHLDMRVREKEILGIAGVSGNGQRELAEVLFGIRMPEEGQIEVNGTALKPGHPNSSINSGMGRIPEDRIATGLLMDLSVEENLILETHVSYDFQQVGLRKFKNIHRFSDDLIRAYNIKTASRDALTKSLSGGNLQKVILARELAGNPKVIIAAQPTRGLDVGAMEYIHARILEEKDRGAAVVLISEDLDEIFNLSDRILVMYEGEVLGEVAAEQADRSQIGLWMSGVRA
jgi:simple sugar transport system ATP-binding protein